MQPRRDARQQAGAGQPMPTAKPSGQRHHKPANAIQSPCQPMIKTRLASVIVNVAKPMLILTTSHLSSFIQNSQTPRKHYVKPPLSNRMPIIMPANTTLNQCASQNHWYHVSSSHIDLPIQRQQRGFNDIIGHSEG
jgi:hypothetical protein